MPLLHIYHNLSDISMPIRGPLRILLPFSSKSFGAGDNCRDAVCSLTGLHGNTDRASLALCPHGNTRRASLALFSHGNKNYAIGRPSRFRPASVDKQLAPILEAAGAVAIVSYADMGIIRIHDILTVSFTSHPRFYHFDGRTVTARNILAAEMAAHPIIRQNCTVSAAIRPCMGK